jgi:hypothetical protein
MRKDPDTTPTLPAAVRVKFDEMTRFPTYVPTLMLRPDGYVAVSTAHAYFVALPAARLMMLIVGPVATGAAAVPGTAAAAAAACVFSTAGSSMHATDN